MNCRFVLAIHDDRPEVLDEELNRFALFETILSAKRATVALIEHPEFADKLIWRNLPPKEGK